MRVVVVVVYVWQSRTTDREREWEKHKTRMCVTPRWDLFLWDGVGRGWGSKRRAFSRPLSQPHTHARARVSL